MEPNRTRTLALVAALMLVTAVALPAAVTASEHSLEIDVDQQRDSGEALVTVTSNDTAVENATVQVNASGNYSANESYQTDENGTVLLPNPNETVEVELTADHNGSNVSTTVELVPLNESLSVQVDQEDAQKPTVTVTQYDHPVENATVNVTVDDENATYEGADGEYSTNQDGNVDLPYPEEDVNVTVTATSGNLSAETQVMLTTTDLAVTVDQEAGENATVTVTHDSDSVENATVNVTVDDENATYDGAGEYSTDENGTVELPAPSETVDVTVSATYGELSAETNATLEGPGLELSAWQGDDGRLYVEVSDDGELVDTATVSVEAIDGNYTYAGGGYTATNGTLSLPAPDENVTVNVTALYDNRTATETVFLDASVDDRPDNFGQTLVKFIEFIKGQDVEGPLGQEISEFVHENNPAADKEPGPPAHVTEENKSNSSQQNGPPAHVTNESESNPGQGNGPHAADDGNESDDDERRGPPGSSNGNGPGNSGQGNGPP